MTRRVPGGVLRAKDSLQVEASLKRLGEFPASDLTITAWAFASLFSAAKRAGASGRGAATAQDMPLGAQYRGGFLPEEETSFAMSLTPVVLKDTSGLKTRETPV